MEGVSPEIQKALADMNWEERLKEARIKRAAVLKARALGESGGDSLAADSARVAEALRFDPDEALNVEAEEPRVEEEVVVPPSRPSRRRLVYAGLAASFAVAVIAGVALLDNPFSQRLTLASDPAPQTGTSAPEAATPPEPVSSVTSVATAVPSPAGAQPPPSLLPEPTTVAAPAVALQLAPRIQAFVREMPGAPQGGASLSKVIAADTEVPRGQQTVAVLVPRLDALPVVGGAPDPAVAAAPVFTAVVASRLDNTAAADAMSTFGAIEIDAGSIQPVAARTTLLGALGSGDSGATPERLPVLAVPLMAPDGLTTTDPIRPRHAALLGALPGASQPEDVLEISVASLEADLPASLLPGPLSEAATSGTPPAVDTLQPAFVMAGAEEMALWIFAASTAEEETVKTAQSLVEGYRVPLVSVNTVSYRISQNQVRFYDASTETAANRIATELGAVARDFTGSGADVEPGTLEIYLAGEAAEVAEPPRPRPSARPPEPAPRQQLSRDERIRSNVISKLRAGMSQ